MIKEKISKFFKWVKHRLKHKLEHLNFSKLMDTLKEHGPALVVIIVVWEIIEDILFPILFIWLGANVHPIFLTGAPVSILLCMHWLAVPVMWGAWVRLKKRFGSQ